MFLTHRHSLKVDLVQYQDGTNSEPRGQLNQEDREFLESAMKEGVMDIAKKLKEISATLSNHEEKSTEEIVNSVEELQELCIDLDTALDLEVVGGVQTLAKLCTPSQLPAVQRAASEVVATVAQNNPRGQAAMIQEVRDSGWMDGWMDGWLVVFSNDKSCGGRCHDDDCGGELPMC